MSESGEDQKKPLVRRVFIPATEKELRLHEEGVYSNYANWGMAHFSEIVNQSEIVTGIAKGLQECLLVEGTNFSQVLEHPGLRQLAFLFEGSEKETDLRLNIKRLVPATLVNHVPLYGIRYDPTEPVFRRIDEEVQGTNLVCDEILLGPNRKLEKVEQDELAKDREEVLKPDGRFFVKVNFVPIVDKIKELEGKINVLESQKTEWSKFGKRETLRTIAHLRTRPVIVDSKPLFTT